MARRISPNASSGGWKRRRRAFTPATIAAPPRSGPAVPLDMKGLLPGLIQAMPDAEGFLAARLWKSWREVVGESIADMARPLGRRRGTLIVGVDEPVAMQELTYVAPEILDRVNEFLGRRLFDKLSPELLNGRVPLDGPASPPPDAPVSPGDWRTTRPLTLGGLDLPEDTPVGRAYRRYVELFKGAARTPETPA